MPRALKSQSRIGTQHLWLSTRKGFPVEAEEGVGAWMCWTRKCSRATEGFDSVGGKAHRMFPSC